MPEERRQPVQSTSINQPRRLDGTPRMGRRLGWDHDVRHKIALSDLGMVTFIAPGSPCPDIVDMRIGLW